MPFLLLLVACGARPGGPPSINGDPAWPSLPSLDNEIVRIMNRDAIAGLSACLIQDGETTWCSGYGQRNPDNGDPALASTPFLLASVSKTVTATADMIAVEEGKLDLDTPVNDVLSFPVNHPTDPGNPITLRRLMSHTAGIQDNWDVMEAHYVDGDSTESLGGFLEDYLSPDGAEYSAEDNYYPEGVGKISEYSNIGAALSGYLVEAATGTPFDDYCDARIFEPLGMTGGWHLADLDPDDVAVPTLVEDGEWVTLAHFGVPDYPDGQLRTNAPSLARFLAMMDQGGSLGDTRIISESTVEEMLTPQYPNLDDTQGLIWYWWTIDGEDVWGHNGGEDGTSTEIVMRERDGVGAVVLMNSEGGANTLEDVERAMFAAAE